VGSVHLRDIKLWHINEAINALPVDEDEVRTAPRAELKATIGRVRERWKEADRRIIAAETPLRPGHVDPAGGMADLTEVDGKCGFNRDDFVYPNNVPEAIAAWARKRFPDGIPDRPEMLAEHRNAFGTIPGVSEQTIQLARRELRDLIKTGAPAHKKNRRGAAPE
jgi:hypothetical protein